MWLEQGNNEAPILDIKQVEGQENKLKITTQLMTRLEEITKKDQGKDKLDFSDLNDLRLIVNLVADFNKWVDEKILIKKAIWLWNEDAKETFINAKDVDKEIIDAKVAEVQAKVNKMLAKYNWNTLKLNEDLKVLLNVDSLISTIDNDSSFWTRIWLSDSDWKQNESVAEAETQIKPSKNEKVAQIDNNNKSANPFSVFRAYNDLKNNTNRINNETEKILKN